MSRIPNTRRLNGRYIFRRRVHYRNLISRPLALALGTADPTAARARAAVLSARFAVVKSNVDAMLEQGRALTGAEIEALFRAELETELRFYVQSAYENASWSSSVPEVAAQEAEAYRIIRRPDRRLGLLDADRADLVRRGLSDDIPQIEEYARQIRELLTDDLIVEKLKAIGAPTHSASVAVARTHLIRASASACDRAQRVFDDDVMDAADPVAALMADLGGVSPGAQRLLAGARPVTPPAAPDPSDGFFLVFDTRPFSDVIDDVLAELKDEGTWSGDVRQQLNRMYVDR